jgi:hypothetical protein
MMTDPNPEIVRRFAQLDRRAAIDTLFEVAWITLYRSEGEESWFSGLVAQENLPKALSDQSWDLHWGQMGPCVVTYGLHDESETGYERFQDDGFEPIVIVRERGSGPFSVELAEDIRLFLNLFPGENGNLVRGDENGDAEVIATVSADEVRIRKGPLLRYLQARQIYLAVYFDHVLHLETYGEHPLPEAERYVDVREADRTWSFGSRSDLGPPFSRLCGKRLLAPPPRPSRAEREADEGRYVAFIIGEDEMGRPREYSADPKSLANLFGKNAHAPNYLSAVHFKREVLDRYFHNPGKYEVGDGVVRNHPHWSMPIDDDHQKRVVAFLGDLGRDLPYTEQMHWRAHNILPNGGLSRTARSRSFDAQPADGEQPEHRFKKAYRHFNKTWLETHGWSLFRPLAPGDQHLLTKLHVPTSDNPAELDAQLVGLAKILIDSLNDAGLDTALASPVPDERSLAKLKRYLTMRKYPEIERDIGALSAIQGLRSTGAAHARGSNYTKALKRRSLEGQPAPVIVSALIEDAITMLYSFAMLSKKVK